MNNNGKKEDKVDIHTKSPEDKDDKENTQHEKHSSKLPLTTGSTDSSLDETGQRLVETSKDVVNQPINNGVNISLNDAQEQENCLSVILPENEKYDDGIMLEGNSESKLANKNQDKYMAVTEVEDLSSDQEMAMDDTTRPAMATGETTSESQPTDDIICMLGVEEQESTEEPTKNLTEETVVFSMNGKETRPPMVTFRELFRFSNFLDKILMVIGSVAAIIKGCFLPLMLLLMGSLVDTLVDFSSSNKTEILNGTSSNPSANFETSIGLITLFFACIGFAAILFGYISIVCWVLAAENQAEVVQKTLFRSIMKKDMSWFDRNRKGELNSRLTNDINNLKKGIGDKVPLFLQFFAAFIAGFSVSFSRGWKLSLVVLAASPLLAITIGLLSKIGEKFTVLELKAYAKAGSIAAEAISSIKTVVSFGGEKKEAIRYSNNLIAAKDIQDKKSFAQSFLSGFFWCVLYCTYALGFWYGTSMVLQGKMTIGTVLTVFFSLFIGISSFGMSMPYITDFSVARGAACEIWKIIDEDTAIDCSSEEGLKLETFEGNLDFQDVTFSYPTRKDVQVLIDFNLKVLVGQTVALVGPSGSGKSTCVQLIQRFYDPDKGSVRFDNIELKDFNLKWLRKQIGVVSQEPVLFATSIAENIRYGQENVTQEEIETAAKEAYIHEFIISLPKGYETMVGDRGAQLSGGQKQRISIARALIRNPKILLLDEATSALDTESETTVQRALDKVKKGRTTLCVAHRLSTIQNADIIVVIKNGKVEEKGTHKELVDLKGAFQQIILAQSQAKEIDQPNLDDKMDDMQLKIKDNPLINPSKEPCSTNKSHNIFRTYSIESSKTTSELDSRYEIYNREEVDDGVTVSMLKLLKLNFQEWPYILIGLSAAAINGLLQPLSALIISSILGVFDEDDTALIRKTTNNMCLAYVGFGILSFICTFLQGFMFGRSGSELTSRLRKLMFSSILKQEINWFDDPKHSPGILTAKLATDASLIHGAAGNHLGEILNVSSALISGLIIALVAGWKMTLVILAFAPLMGLAGFFNHAILTGSIGKSKNTEETCEKICSEAIDNVKTVASLTREDTFISLYEKELKKPYRRRKIKSHIYGLTYGFSQGCLYFALAASFRFGAYLVEIGEMDYQNVFLVFGAIVVSATRIGRFNSFSPDLVKAKAAAKSYYELQEKDSIIDSSIDQGLKLDYYEPHIAFSNVSFNYPTRPGVAVLKELELIVKPETTVAVVGASGCGKSTILQLMERFYDPAKGTIYFDRENLNSLNIKWLRSQIGMVSQEPVLFSCSIRENIEYGDNSRQNVSMEEIIEAAKQANIHSFIQALPQGYETQVGDKGGQLSGGQKQRVAIARALIRNPKILLLDEATSALDTESEKIVQAALDKAKKGRTCIVIAHRLSTVRNASKIIVMQNGKVVEEGKHTDLMTKKGTYYKLNNIQFYQADEIRTLTE